MKKTERITIRLDEATMKKLKDMTDSTGESYATVIADAINDHVPVHFVNVDFPALKKAQSDISHISSFFVYVKTLLTNCFNEKGILPPEKAAEVIYSILAAQRDMTISAQELKKSVDQLLEIVKIKEEDRRTATAKRKNESAPSSQSATEGTGRIGTPPEVSGANEETIEAPDGNFFVPPPPEDLL